MIRVVKRCAFVLCCAWLFSPSFAFAQANGTSPEPSLLTGPFYFGFHVASPIILTSPVAFTSAANQLDNLSLDNKYSLAGGLGIGGRVGYELTQRWSIEMRLQFSTNSFFAQDAPSWSLRNGSLYVGGRYSFINPSRLVPWVGAGLGGIGWQVNNTDGKTGSSISPAFGFYAGAGALYEISKHWALELSLLVNGSVGGTLFESSALFYLTPQFGALFFF